MNGKWEQKEKNEFLFRYYKMHHLFWNRLRFLATQNDIYPGQTRILFFLSQQEEVTQKNLCRLMEIRPASMTDVLQRMEKNGLLERKTDETDLRSIRVSITEKGRKKAETALKVGEKMEQECFEKFTAEEKEIFISLMERMIENLAELGSPPSL